MKQLASLILTGVLLILGSLMFNIPFVQIGENPVWMSYVAVPVAVTIFHTIYILGVIVLALLPSGLIFGWGLKMTGKEVVAMAAVLGVLFALFSLPYIMTVKVPELVEWFPQFKWWQYALFLIFSALFNWESSDKKK